MTDDQTRSHEKEPAGDPPTTDSPATDTTATNAPTNAPLRDTAATPANPAPAADATAAAASDAAPATASAAGSAPPPAAPAVPATAPAGRPGGTGLRWALGLGLAGLVLVVTAAAVFLMGSSTAPEALKYVPADAAVVMEARFDLPGDQMQKLGNLLAHFPGFADQSTLTAKIDEAFSRLVDTGSGGAVDYATRIKPWLNGPLFVAGDATAFAEGESADTERFLLSATTNNGVACDTTFEGEQVAHETYRGLDLVSIQGGAVACVIDGRIGLLGDAASIKEALDAKADGRGMDKAAAYAAARQQLTGDQLATIFIDGKSLQAAMPAPSALPIPGLDAFATRIPDWVVLGVRAEDDAMIFEGVVAPVPAPSTGASLLPAPQAHASLITPLVPAGSLVYFEDQGTGVSLQNLFSQLRSVPDLQAPLQMLDGVGGPAGLVGWIDDVAVAATATNPTLDNPNARISVYLAAKDDASAAEKVATVNTFLGLAGLSGEGIAVSNETLSAVQVTNVTVTDLGSIVPPGSVPGLDTGSLEAPISFSIAVKGRVILLTVGDGAMAEVLAVGAGSSLADDAAFKLAAQRGLANSKTTLYAAVGATVDLVQGLLPPEMVGQWTNEIAPYVDPLEALGFSLSMDASATRSRLVLTVNQP
jgi:hypothetical protein